MHCIVALTVFDKGGLVGAIPDKGLVGVLLGNAWTEAALRVGTPVLLTGDGCNGGTTSTAEELLMAAVVAVVVSAGLISLVDDCLQYVY